MMQKGLMVIYGGDDLMPLVRSDLIFEHDSRENRNCDT